MSKGNELASAGSPDDIVQDFHPRFRVYRDGRVERLKFAQIVPPSDDPETAVRSKDVVISPETKVSARLYLPRTADKTRKLPLIVYIHGGAFVWQSAFSTEYYNYLNLLTGEANAVAVSVEYRLAPENPIPACYDDVWTALQWVAQHAAGQGPDPWLNDHADFGRIFVVGDSAGANIGHNMVVRAGSEGLGSGMKLEGLVLLHPFFGNEEPDRLWTYICPGTSGVHDPLCNPAAHPDLLSNLACGRVLVCTAEKDELRERGRTYYEALRQSGWVGSVELVETEGEGHVFHLINPGCERAGSLLKRVASFINHS